MAKSIQHYLDFRIGRFRFTYLGIQIVPRRIRVNHFNPMVAKVSNTIASWTKGKISSAGKTTLINSSILASPAYYFSVYRLPDPLLTLSSNWLRSSFGLEMVIVVASI